MNLTSQSALEFLSAHGVSALPENGAERDEKQLVSCFQNSYPGNVSLSGEGRVYLSALTDCLCAMDERLYRCYRPMTDLFRRFVLEAAPSADPEDPLWKEVLMKGDRLGAIDPDNLVCHPHKN